MMHSRKILLLRNSKPWVKKDGNEDFDVSVGCYDGVDICELVGSFILNQLGPAINKNDIDLYRDDGLRIFRGILKPMIERKKKTIVNTFKQCGLAIAIKYNLKFVNFLDITLDLQNNVYKPYRKANDKPTYINKNSNHPASILKQLTKSIEERPSETSSSKDISDKSLKLYQNALKDSGFSNDLRYFENNNIANDGKRTRKRKIIWFNAPFSKSVKTNIGKIFLQLLSKHFPKNHKIHQIFNRNTFKMN